MFVELKDDEGNNHLVNLSMITTARREGQRTRLYFTADDSLIVSLKYESLKELLKDHMPKPKRQGWPRTRVE